MRAVNGAVVSSRPCSLAKSIRVLARFNASHLPSSDAATYLRTTAEAANDLYIFRRDLRKSHRLKQRDDVEAAHERERGESKRERDHGIDEEEKKEIDIDGDLGSGKKRKKKRSRIDDIDNGYVQELVEHTNKKRRK